MEEDVKVLKGVFTRPRMVGKKGVVVSLGKYKFALNRKSIWSILRHNFTHAIDEEIKSQTKSGVSLADFFVTAFRLHRAKPKEMQFFVDLKDEKCLACATLKHPILEPDKVYEVFDKALKKHKLKLEEKSGLKGKVLILQKSKVASFGLRIDAGNIYTDRAIRISSYVEILQCLNPISFAGLSRGQLTTTMQPVKVRILRYEGLTKIPERINEAVITMKPELVKIEKLLIQTQKRQLTQKQAKAIIVAFGTAYGIGAKALKKTFERFRDEEKQTQYGLSMALSWVVEHEDDVFRKDTSEAKTNLATIAGATLLITKINQTAKFCEDFIKKEPVAEVALARVEGKLPLGRRTKKKGGK